MPELSIVAGGPSESRDDPAENADLSISRPPGDEAEKGVLRLLGAGQGDPAIGYLSQQWEEHPFCGEEISGELMISGGREAGGESLEIGYRDGPRWRLSEITRGGLHIALERVDRIVGFGAGTAAWRDGERFQLLNLDTLFYSLPGRSYSSFPFFIMRRGSRCLGLLWNSILPAEVRIDPSAARPRRLTIDPLTDLPGRWDLLLLAGPLSQILNHLTALTGRPHLPPAWAFGYHQSRWSYLNADRVLTIARRLRQHRLPADAIHLDIHYMDRYRVFTWHPRRFPNPQALHRQLATLGLRSVAIVDPGVALAKDYPVCDEGRAAGYFCPGSASGDDESPFIGRVWPGAALFPDLSRQPVREWWADQHRPLLEAGVSGIWNDMNDPTLFVGAPFDPLTAPIRAAAGPHPRWRNRYANWQAEAAALAQLRGSHARIAQPQKESDERSTLARIASVRRPFVLTRSATLGIQRHAFMWSGDNRSSWRDLRENLHMVIHLGLSGQPFSGADVGGFANDLTWLPAQLRVFKPFKQRELFARWFQLGALMPFFRAHTTLYSHAQEPWSFGRRILKIARRHLTRRYRLLPYLISLAWSAHRSGQPLVRPLWYEFPDTPEGLGEDQFMLGPHLLAAPVLERGARRRRLYLPPGEWYELTSGRRLEGPREIEQEVTLEDYPLWVRGGAILPMAKQVGRNAEETLASGLSLAIFPATEMEGHILLDDGISRGGPRLELTIEGDLRYDSLRLNIECEEIGYRPPFEQMEIQLPPAWWQVTVDNRWLEGSEQRSQEGEQTGAVRLYPVPIGDQQLHFRLRTSGE